jgi:chaperonin cofactor prefoldin
VENESYGLRLEKKIDSLQSEIRTLTDHITRHTFVNEVNQSKISELTKSNESIDSRVNHIEARQSSQDGGISVIKYILGSISGIVLAACIWVGSSIIQINQDLTLIKDKIVRLEAYHK